MNRLFSLRPYLDVRTVKMGVAGIPEQGLRQPLDEGTVHVWSASYSDLGPDVPFLSALATKEEVLQASGYKKTGDARRYILRRGLVRAVLGQYLGRDPEKIRITRGENGKPALARENTVPDIRFSLSRTDERVSLAITRNSAIGLDIVRVGNRYSIPEIGRYLFTPQEQAWIAQAAPVHRATRFFRIWSLKEAVLKATGGSARMMQEVDVSEILRESCLNGRYALNTGDQETDFCIHESGCDAGDRLVIATHHPSGQYPSGQ